ncbi:MAG: hypothetical protein H7062_06135 [Candidatus Saccharimonas sp.]|nr:hypothetical protein [Planctomycetaceae bacterium]
MQTSIPMLAFATCLAFGPHAFAAGEVFAPMKVDDARSQVLAWAASQPSVAEDKQRELAALWVAGPSTEEADRLLDLVVRSFAAVDADAAKLFAACNTSAPGLLPPEGAFLKQAGRDPFFAANLGLFYGRFLVERRMFDEALEQLKAVDPQRVVDPASLFFFKAVAAQGMLEVKPALEALDTLLKSVERVPVRYSATATLMEADLKGLEEKSLGEIARLMSDSERRLDLGRAGEKVQGVQERIIAELDEIIKKTEAQQGGGGGAGDGQGGNSNESSNPANDSSIKGAEAPGDVDKKKFSKDGNWGNLPGKDQAKAKSDLNRNFPSHYGRAIDQYFRKQSERAAKNKP